MRAILSCRTSLVVKKKWIVICPGLRSTHQLTIGKILIGQHIYVQLLKERALDVYDRLSNEDAADYDKIKEALLKNSDMTERGFRKKNKSKRIAFGNKEHTKSRKSETRFVCNSANAPTMMMYGETIYGRHKFRYSRHEKFVTFIQFSSRLAS